MEKLTKKQAEKVYDLLGDKIVSVSLHYNNGAELRMSVKQFKEIINR